MKLKIQDSDVGKRLDVFLTENIAELNRSSVEKLLNENQVTVNEKPITKSGYKIKANDKIAFLANLGKLLKPDEITLPIIYEDDDCIVINKPAGILTHSKGEFNNEGTVASFIAPKVHDTTSNRAGIVHRLDRATSGVIICTKNEDALKMLQEQFSNRKVTKKYIAVIKSGLEPKEAVIDIPIARNKNNPKTFTPSSDGKSAQTKYKITKSNADYSMVELTPRTGRTHQLRVHLKYTGFPIVGDDLYGGEEADRLYLHALSLKLKIPSGKEITFTAELPDSFSSEFNL